jgi:hypothetical protein
VTLNGPTPLTGTTDADGCVRFNELEAGPYTVSFQRTDWVNVLHESAISDSVTVVAGETGNKTFEYDHGGGFNVGFRKRRAAAPGYTDTPVPAVQFENAGLAVPGVLNTTNPANTIGTESKPMFPHSSQYTVKAESCASAVSLGGVGVARGDLNPGTRTYFYLPQLQLQISGLSSGQFAAMGIDKRTLRVKVQSPCGTFVTPVAGQGGSPADPADVWTSDPVPVPPGTMTSVCVLAYRNVAPTGWAYARSPSTFNLGLAADETDANGELYRFGIEFDLAIGTPPPMVATPEQTCPAV